MAKDKSKPSKSTNDEFAKPSEAPAGGDGWKLATPKHVGDLFLVTPLREQTVKGFEDSDAEVIVADVVHLNEKKPEKSEEHEEVFIFGAWLKGSLRGFIGERKVLARLDQDKSKGRGNNAAWVFEDADADDIAVAKAYLASVDPFAQKSSKKADDKPSKGGKKAKGK
jgi:hypothetical protein